ncbi:monocarboxylate transporter 12-like [Ptychodera flava]|uniref:monocarboxylate transporter 12-like n=1 Tax=Ptychodera flava TaxID=63121 RepID=UPI003969F84F
MSDKTTDQIRTGPDGGWGWMVVVAGFIVQFMTGGLAQSLSPLYIDIKRYFGSSAEDTSWIFSISSAMFFCTGILGSVTAKLFGHRLTVMVGGMLISSGFFISYFATNIVYLYGSIGVVAGIGLGMGPSPNLAMLAIYFPKKHSLVNGIAMVGSGVCVLVMPPLLQASIDKYGWRGSMLILSAIGAHVDISGALLRPLIGNSRARNESDDLSQEPDETDDKDDGGWIYDVTGNYDYSFYALGGFHLLGGFICIIGQCITWKRNRKWTEKVDATSQVVCQKIVNPVYDDSLMKDATSQTFISDFVDNNNKTTDWILDSPFGSESHAGKRNL